MNQRSVLLLLFGLSILFSSLSGLADEKQVLNALHNLFPDRQPDQVNNDRIPGWHEAVYGTQIFYVSDNGRFVMQGDIYDLQHQKNITEEIRITQRKQVLESLDDEHLIVFKPKKTLYHLVVFSDIDCGYCRKLHSEIQNYLDLGIEIRYVLFPRTGEYTPSYYKAVSVWCSDDRQKSLTLAKRGVVLPRKQCKNPILDNIQMASKLDISGTPTLIFPDGEVIPGYVPAAELAQYLAESAAGHKLPLQAN